ncbi:cysteine protease ATG4D-like [Babylonia areolata]|uniref:cysteine protease ATG4D-like n=1 Tax=Babylonia areolata TaxID=304850 RepID=UPI003FD1DF45
MAAADPVRSVSRLSSDRSGSFSDDVVSLDSWSEKLEASASNSKDWPVDCERRPRLSSADSTVRSAVTQQRVRHPPFKDVRKQKTVTLRSAPPNPKPAATRDNMPVGISTISARVEQNREYGLYGPPSRRRRSSSASSDSDPSPLHSPRHSAHELSPQSPNRRIPTSGSRYHGGGGGGHFQFAHHLRPHYSSSPVHRGPAGHPAHQVHSPPPPHHHPHHQRGQSPRHQPHYNNPSSPRHHPHQYPGVRYYSSQYPHQSSYHSANNAPIDQILEREGEKLKTKMKSMWNNVKYGWTIKTKTSFKYDSPIFLLGRCYHRRADELDQTEADLSPQQPYRVSALDEFHADFTSRLWFTYRREFSPIGSSRMTTDCGWGCMLRSGQMLMAQGLVLHFLKRDWKVYSEQRPEDLAFYREIIRWFGDQPSDKVPFSLHRLVELGTSVGKMPGDWYGPASVAHIFRDATDKAHMSLPILSDICVYVAQDCTIYLQDLKKILISHGRTGSQRSRGNSVTEGDPVPPPAPAPNTSSSSTSSQQVVGEEKFRSVIILVPMRLGGETLNEIYIPCVKSMLAHDQCIGIIGGRPKHSLYFVGWQDDKLIYLDPHYCQDTVDTTQTVYPIQSFHCMSPRKMLFTKMDPSCTVGFYCRNRQDLDTFIDQVPDMVVPPRQRGQYPLFVVSEGSSDDTHARNVPVRELGRLRIRHLRSDGTGKRVRSPTLDSEDFVIL